MTRSPLNGIVLCLNFESMLMMVITGLPANASLHGWGLYYACAKLVLGANMRQHAYRACCRLTIQPGQQYMTNSAPSVCNMLQQSQNPEQEQEKTRMMAFCMSHLCVVLHSQMIKKKGGL